VRNLPNRALAIYLQHLRPSQQLFSKQVTKKILHLWQTPPLPTLYAGSMFHHPLGKIGLLLSHTQVESGINRLGEKLRKKEKKKKKKKDK